MSYGNLYEDEDIITTRPKHNYRKEDRATMRDLTRRVQSFDPDDIDFDEYL